MKKNCNDIERPTSKTSTAMTASRWMKCSVNGQRSEFTASQPINDESTTAIMSTTAIVLYYYVLKMLTRAESDIISNIYESLKEK
jgi:hypothetical protein